MITIVIKVLAVAVLSGLLAGYGSCVSCTTTTTTTTTNTAATTTTTTTTTASTITSTTTSTAADAITACLLIVTTIGSSQRGFSKGGVKQSGMFSICTFKTEPSALQLHKPDT